MGVSASARFSQNNSNPAGAKRVYNTVDLTYSPMAMSFQAGLEVAADFHAVFVNWAQYRLMTDKAPVYLQYGAGLHLR